MPQDSGLDQGLQVETLEARPVRRGRHQRLRCGGVRQDLVAQVVRPLRLEGHVLRRGHRRDGGKDVEVEFERRELVVAHVDQEIRIGFQQSLQARIDLHAKRERPVALGGEM